MSKQFDIVVAGGGHNSLVSAAYLAKAGLRVLVLEGRDVIGGNTVTEELTIPGFWHDSCSSAHTLIQSSPTLRHNELGLDKYGLRYLHPDPVVTMPFADGSSLTMWRDIERTIAEFARFSPQDAQAYRRMIAEYDAIKKVFGQYRYTPIGYGPTLDELLAAQPDGAVWIQRYKSSALEIINDYFSHEHIRTFMLWLAFMTIQPFDVPGTGRLAFGLANGRQHYSWVTPVGGSGALPHALVAQIKDQGGEVLTGKYVTELVLENGRCTGVKTADGSTYIAQKAVLSTIHIKHLVEMAPQENWDETFIEGVSNWEPGFTLFAAHYALSEAPLYTMGEGRLPSVAAGVAGSVANMQQLVDAIRHGRIHQSDPVLLVICSTVADHSRAPAGKHTLKILSFFPYDLADGGPEEWDSIKNEVAQRNLDHLRRFAPNLTDEVILGVDVESPVDLERRNPHNWHGTCHGGSMLPSQSGSRRPVAGWASHRMPIPGLYQTGATTHPGGSVSAGPGRNAAWVMLDDMGIALKDVIASKSKAHN